MAQRYANIMKTFIVALIYAPFLPVGLLIAPMGIAFDYWVAKYLLLRRHSRPKRISSDMADAIMAMIPPVIFLYAFMNWVF